MGSDILGGAAVPAGGVADSPSPFLGAHSPFWSGVGSKPCRLRKEEGGQFSPTEWGSLVQGPGTPGNHSWELGNRTGVGHVQAAAAPMMAPPSPSPAHRPELVAFLRCTPRTEAWPPLPWGPCISMCCGKFAWVKGGPLLAVARGGRATRLRSHVLRGPAPIPAEGVGPRWSRHARLTVQLVLREAGPAQVPHGEQGYRVGRRREGPEGDSRQRRLVHTPLHGDPSEGGRTERGEGFLRLS